MRQLPQRELLAAAPCGQGSGTVSGTFNAGGGLSVEMRSRYCDAPIASKASNGSLAASAALMAAYFPRP